MITALVVLAVWTGASVLAAGAWSCVAAAHKRRPRAAIPAPPPPDDPDATADDYGDEDRVERIATLPPVPVPARWSEADDAMVAWFVAGRADR